MTMTLIEALEDVFVFAARPRLLAGNLATSPAVRWVHASEQLDIGPLLRGGELILMEGINLRSSTEVQQKNYLDSLLEAGVAGLAIEPTEHFAQIPSVMLKHADAIGLPVIELRKRVPFVQICESVNSQLADASLRRVELADRMSTALSASLHEVPGIVATLEVLAKETHSDVVLTSLSGEVLGHAGNKQTTNSPLFTATVAFGGTVVATLALQPAPDADIYVISAALERAPEILAIALLNFHPLSPEERMRTRFLSLVSADASGPSSEDPSPWEAIADRLGLDPEGAYLSLQVNFQLTAWVGELSEALRQISPLFVGQLMGTEYVAILPFGNWEDLDRGRTNLIEALERVAGEMPEAGICVGPGVRGRNRITRCLTEARRTLDIAGKASGGRVHDARDFAVARLRDAIANEDVAQDFVDEQIGALLRRDEDNHGELFETLLAYATNWGSKTDAAKALDVQRQTLYQRLEKIFSLIGPLPENSNRIPGILTAVFLEQARRRIEDSGS